MDRAANYPNVRIASEDDRSRAQRETSPTISPELSYSGGPLFGIRVTLPTYNGPLKDFHTEVLTFRRDEAGRMVMLSDTSINVTELPETHVQNSDQEATLIFSFNPEDRVTNFDVRTMSWFDPVWGEVHYEHPPAGRGPFSLRVGGEEVNPARIKYLTTNRYFSMPVSF